MNKEILVSICIPTYNRADILNQNIRNLLLLPSFDDEVELVVSDNCSSDHTCEVVKNIIREYPTKRIVYQRNRENILDKNFLKALSVGKGRYLKLFNDYTTINNENLQLIKNTIFSNASEDCIFFYDRLRDERIAKSRKLDINSLDEFVRLVNNKITWIPNFGCWADQLNELYQYEESSNLQLLQMQWTLHLVSKANKVKVVGMCYDIIPRKKDYRLSYDFFQVHIGNYYSILEDYCNKKKLMPSTIRYDKKRVLQDFVGKSIMEYLILRKGRRINYKKSWEIVFNCFGKIPFFYIMPLVMPFVWVWNKFANR